MLLISLNTVARLKVLTIALLVGVRHIYNVRLASCVFHLDPLFLVIVDELDGIDAVLPLVGHYLRGASHILEAVIQSAVVRDGSGLGELAVFQAQLDSRMARWGVRRNIRWPDTSRPPRSRRNVRNNVARCARSSAVSRYKLPISS